MRCCRRGGVPIDNWVPFQHHTSPLFKPRFLSKLLAVSSHTHIALAGYLHTNKSMSSNPATEQGLEATWQAGGFVTFPAKLIELLGCPELSESLRWSNDGTAVIFNLKNIEKQVLTPHFHGTKVSSFTRKLNRWGFRKIKLPRNSRVSQSIQ